MAWSIPSIYSENAPDARAAHSCNVIGKYLYVFGGWNGRKALNDLHILDTEELRWISPETSGKLPACRNNHTTAVVANKIFVHGGHDGNHWLSDLYILDTSNYVWYKPNLAGQAPSARACHTMSRVGRKLYLFGGYDGLRCFNDVDVIDIENMTWIKPNVTGTGPQARNAHSMTVVGKKLFLFGGHSGNKHLKDLLILDTEEMVWSEPMIYGTPPKGLRGHTANLIGSKIYLFGGYDGRGRSNELYILSTENMHWTHPLEVEKAPEGRQRHTSCTVGTKQLFIFGGFDGNKWLNDVYLLDVGKLEANKIAGETIDHLISNLRSLINNPVFADIAFVVEGKKIYAHKAILVAQSEHFKAMFLAGMKETQETVVEIPDWTYSSYLHMIEFLYTGNILNFTVDIAGEVIGLADAYTLEGLKKMCENTLLHSIDIENACELLILSHRYSAEELKKFCMAFVIKHFQQINRTPAFERLEQVPNLLIEVTRAVFARNEYI